MFDIIEFITRLFRKEEKNLTGLMAKERLKFILVSDRAMLSPHLMQCMRDELLEVISRYMVIDNGSVEMGLERKGKAMALAASVPIVSVKRDRKTSKGGNGSSRAGKSKKTASRSRQGSIVDKTDAKKKTSLNAEIREEKRERVYGENAPSTAKAEKVKDGTVSPPTTSKKMITGEAGKKIDAGSPPTNSTESSSSEIRNEPVEVEIRRKRRRRKKNRRYLARASGGRRSSRKRMSV